MCFSEDVKRERKRQKRKNDKKIFCFPGGTVLDEAACQLGPSYARGGVEFYDKMLQRHIALREMLPDGKGKTLFNLKGENYSNLKSGIHIRYSDRRDNCRKFVSKQKSSFDED